MFNIFLTHKIITGLSIVILLFTGYYLWTTYTKDPLADIITSMVDQGDVREIITVSGFVESKNTANLGFSVPGILSSIAVTEGDTATKGQILATLDKVAIQAERAQAVAAKAAAASNRAELLSGPSTESRNITNETIVIAKAELARVTGLENERVKNAALTLRSAGLFATSDTADEDSPAPSITGTYICEQEGDYIMTLYKSGSDSGYSMNLSGIENGTYVVSTDQDIPFGTCGLRAKFTTGARYNDSIWTIEIPNTKSPLYTANKNSFELAQTTAKNNIAAAKQAVSLAELEQTKENATPRSEAIARADANVNEAQARITQIDAKLNNLTLTAPFTGTVTTVSAIPGENVTTNPIIKLVAEGRYILKARIPEIDITDIKIGQKARIVFDARDTEIFAAEVTYISPAATEISGVTYYETEITLTNPPDWLRGGLNADVEIIINESLNTARIPRRFVIKNGDAYQTRTLNNNNLSTTTIEVTLLGNDGFAAISGLNIGDVVVAP